MQNKHFHTLGNIGIRAQLYSRQHINKMFHISLSGLAVCMKSAPQCSPVHSLPSLSTLHRLIFSASLHMFSFAWCYKEKPQVCTRGASKMREERKSVKCFYFSCVIFSFFFSCASCILPPLRTRLLECHSKWTQELWGLTLSPCFPGKTSEELFYQTGPMENPSFSISFVFILKMCRW